MHAIFPLQLKKGDVVFPRRQKVARLPDVKLTHREKEIDINAFKSSSGNNKREPPAHRVMRSREYGPGATRCHILHGNFTRFWNNL